MEDKFIGLPYTAPYKKSALAHYFKLKGAIGSIEHGIECYMESAFRYSKVDDISKERECKLMMKLFTDRDERMDVETIKKFQDLYSQCNNSFQW